MLSPYDYRTEEIRNKIMGNMRSWIPNKYYKSAEGNFYFYINTKGWLHLVKLCRVSYDGVFSHYEISNYLLTKDNLLRDVSGGKYYKTREDCIAAIEVNLAEEVLQ